MSEKTLLELIAERLTLSESEKEFLEHLEQGKIWDKRTGDPNEDNLENARNWTNERVLKSEVINKICNNDYARDRVAEQGIQIIGVRIMGCLNLANCKFSKPISFTECHINNPITLNKVTIDSLTLSGTYFGDSDKQTSPNLVISNSEIQMDFQLINGCKSYGFISLGEKVVINRNLKFEELELNGNVNGDMLKVAGDFEIKALAGTSGIYINNCKITGNLICNGASVENAQLTLEAGSAIVEGKMELSDFEHCTIQLPKAKLNNLKWERIADLRKSTLNLTDAEIRSSLVIDEWDIPEKDKFKIDRLQCASVTIKQSGFFSRCKDKGEAFQRKDRPFLAQSYDHLADHMLANGFTENAREILIAKGNIKRKTLRPLSSKSYFGVNGATKYLRWLSLVMQWVWYSTVWRLAGYGHRGAPLLALAVVLIFCGAFVFYYANQECYMIPLKADADLRHYPPFNSLTYSIEVFTPLIKLRQVDFWHVDPTKEYACALRTLVLIHTFLGFIIVPTLLATLKGFLTSRKQVAHDGN